MELTRRDALAALAAAGVAGVAVGGGVVLSSDGEERSKPAEEDASETGIGERELTTLVAAAEVLYPSEVEGIEGFVVAYVEGLGSDRSEHVAGMARSADYLHDYAMSWYDEGFGNLDRATREEALRVMGADTADPHPAGSDVERVRYYVVNELLFALYTSPTGGTLVGIENPQGHPGGLASYQRGPREP